MEITALKKLVEIGKNLITNGVMVCKSETINIVGENVSMSIPNSGFPDFEIDFKLISNILMSFKESVEVEVDKNKVIFKERKTKIKLPTLNEKTEVPTFNIKKWMKVDDEFQKALILCGNILPSESITPAIKNYYVDKNKMFASDRESIVIYNFIKEIYDGDILLNGLLNKVAKKVKVLKMHLSTNVLSVLCEDHITIHLPTINDKYPKFNYEIITATDKKGGFKISKDVLTDFLEKVNIIYDAESIQNWIDLTVEEKVLTMSFKNERGYIVKKSTIKCDKSYTFAISPSIIQNCLSSLGSSVIIKVKTNEKLNTIHMINLQSNKDPNFVCIGVCRKKDFQTKGEK